MAKIADYPKLHGKDVTSIEYDVSSNSFYAFLLTGRDLMRGGFENKETVEVEISREDFMRLESELLTATQADTA